MRPLRRFGSEELAGLVDHLGEFRARLVVSAVALAAGFGVAYGFHAHLIRMLNKPLGPGHEKPITLGVTEPFMTSMKISLVAGFALALPVILWQVWSFLAPAFRKGTERAILYFVGLATLLFAAGVTFSYTVALPASVGFLTTYDSHIFDIQVRASSYYSFAILVLLSVGIVFELPIFVVALVRLGITTSRKLRRNRRIGYAAMAALAVALPGVDPVTTAFEMVPLMVLFESSIWLSVVLERRWRTTASTGPLPA